MRTLLRLTFVLAALTAPLARGGAQAGPPAGPADRPTGFPAACRPGEVQVMLLGTFHFEGSARDDHSAPPFDARSAGRQAELDTVAARLARWAPQQVAVERSPRDSAALRAEFARYVAAGGTTASANEVQQLAFPLARRLGLPGVDPIDHPMPIGNDSIGALLARRPDLRQRSDSLGKVFAAEDAASDRRQAALTLLERLRVVNGDSALHAGNSGSMFYYLGAGEGTNRGGPQLLTRWYERNFYMAHNLTRAVRPGTRRVLVLVGSGHVPPLRNILDESPEYCPVSPLPYLR